MADEQSLKLSHSTFNFQDFERPLETSSFPESFYFFRKSYLVYSPFFYSSSLFPASEYPKQKERKRNSSLVMSFQVQEIPGFQRPKVHLGVHSGLGLVVKPSARVYLGLRGSFVAGNQVDIVDVEPSIGYQVTPKTLLK